MRNLVCLLLPWTLRKLPSHIAGTENGIYNKHFIQRILTTYIKTDINIALLPRVSHSELVPVAARGVGVVLVVEPPQYLAAFTDTLYHLLGNPGIKIGFLLNLVLIKTARNREVSSGHPLHTKLLLVHKHEAWQAKPTILLKKTKHHSDMCYARM